MQPPLLPIENVLLWVTLLSDVYPIESFIPKCVII